MNTRRHLAPLLAALLLVACSAGTGARSASVSGPGTTPTPARQLTPIEQLGKTGTPVEFDMQTYRLVVDGLVENPLSLSYDEVLKLPAVTLVPRLECPGFFVDIAEWKGPLVRTLLEKAGVKPGANQVEFYDGDQEPYHKALTLDEALVDDTYVAYQVNGQTLPVEHGYPLRLVVGSKLGSYWVKWLVRIEVKQGAVSADPRSPVVADFPRVSPPS